VNRRAAARPRRPVCYDASVTLEGSGDAGDRGFPPAQFDDYDVIRALGAGGMGTVYLGHDRMLDRPVALKFIAAVDPDPRARERFREEARAIARLHHPNVVGIYRIGTVEDRPYLAYEVVDGQPLHHLARPMPWRRAVDLGLGLARGLAAVHASGVLHRDIKPANVVVGPGDVAKLIDFGLARRLDGGLGAIVTTATAEALSALSTEIGLTSAGGVAGTPLYMAPELWTGAPPSPDSDVYALGLVLWEMLGGELPHARQTGDALVGAIIGRPVPSIASRRQDLPAPLVRLVDRCIARDPIERPGCGTLRDQLETLRAVYAPLVGAAWAGEVAADEAAAADALSASLGRATASPDAFATRFYDHVFATDPALRPLFPADMRAQRVKLVSTLQTVVRNARSPELLVPLLEDLGRRHHDYGVRPEHFDVVGQALLAALAELEGEAWTPALETLWASAYQHIADHMGRGLAAATGSSPRVPPPRLPRRSISPPAPRYARAGGAVIAHQVVGVGPRDLVVMPGWVSHVELAWQEPAYAELLARLAGRDRVILFDRRGTGLSDRTPDGLGLEQRIGDLLEVLDAAGSERPVLLAWGDSVAVAAMFAAIHGERVRGLVLYGGSPAMLAADGAGLTPAALDAACDAILAGWGGPLFVEQQAPSRARDDAFRAWWARYLRSSATPTVAIAMLRAAAALDVRAALPAIRTPTLVVHRRGDRLMPLAGGRALAAAIAGAQLVELDGDDHMPFAGDVEPLLGAIDGFVADMPTVHAAPVRLVTVLAARVPPAAAGAWQQVVQREGGVTVEDPDGALARFDVPGAAVRVARKLARELDAAAIHVAIVPGRVDGSEPVAAVARRLLAAARAGELWLSETAHALAGGEVGPTTPRGGDEGVRAVATSLAG